MLQQAFEDTALSQPVVYEWIKRFKGGQASLKDRVPGVEDHQQAEIRKNINLHVIREKVYRDRRLTVRELSNESGLSFGSVQSIFKNRNVKIQNTT